MLCACTGSLNPHDYRGDTWIICGLQKGKKLRFKAVKSFVHSYPARKQQIWGLNPGGLAGGQALYLTVPLTLQGDMMYLRDPAEKWNSVKLCYSIW